MSKKVLVALSAPFAAAGAFAQTVPSIDVTAVTGFIDGLLAPIAAIGASYLIVAYAIKGWRLMRSV